MKKLKLYSQVLIMLIRKFILRQNTGRVVRDFCEKMGIVYIKLAQILATQNFGNLFTEEDRQVLSSICDNCQPIDFAEIKAILEKEYGQKLVQVFESIDEEPIGSASISQVHKAVLKSGQTVAIKVRRQDITEGIEKDINRIRKYVRRFGGIFGFKNMTGGNKAFGMYLDWIKQETDFRHELENIKTYRDFAESVNGKIDGAKNIKVPKTYNELCSENIIVMEFIEAKTINKLPLTDENKSKIADALNTYLRLSFWALFNDQSIVFHGDPHGGNIYIDNAGNIGFLDMGLIFELSPNDVRQVREFFFNAYFGRAEALSNSLFRFGHFSEKEKREFRQETLAFCRKVKTMPVTKYFVEMMTVCFKYNIAPQDFLFKMSKAFVCLDGISVFSENPTKATELLRQQVIEYYIKSSINDGLDLAQKGLFFAPSLIQTTMEHGIAKGLAQKAIELKDMKEILEKNLNNCKDMLSLLE